MEVAVENKLRYDKYKDSGMEWLGQIPEHWEVNKLKNLGYIYAGLSGKNGSDFDKVYKESLKPFIPFTTICNYSQINEANYQYVKVDENEVQNIVKKNDLLFLMSSETIEDIARCSIFLREDKVFLNSFCKAFRIESKKLNPIFANYLIGSAIYRAYFNTVGRGFTRINIKQEYINNVNVILPSLSEQQAIANFLDDKCSKIDAAVLIKQKQIAILKERRQIAIHQAVTRGLAKNVPLKDSGVEWIGEIPEHWKVVKNKTLFKETKLSGQEDLPLLSVSIHNGVSSEELKDEDNVRGRVKIADKTEYKLVEKNDIVFNMMRAWQGAIGSVTVKGLVSPAYVVARPRKEINAKFFEFQYRTYPFIQQMNQSSKGITDFRKRLYWDEFKQLFTVITSVQEQNKISSYIESVSKKTDTAISIKEQEINKLKEYKKTLINSTVTGKIKVNYE